MKKNRTYELGSRLLSTFIVLSLFLIGRSVLLFGVDIDQMGKQALDSQNLMVTMLSGDRNRYSLMALGIMPYITSSIIVQFASALRSSEAKARTSPQKMEKLILIFTIALSLILAINRSSDLAYKNMSIDTSTLRILAIVQMMAGAIVLYLLANWNKDHGVGGQTPVIVVNILNGLIVTVSEYTWEDLKLIAAISLVIGAVMLIFENIIIQLPVQRVSIHNIYADKNYVGYKLNPIGSMPVMFATAVLLLPQQLAKFLLLLRPHNQKLIWINDNLVLTKELGIWIYLAIVFFLTVLFAFLMINPFDISEQLQKNGDSLVNVYAGKATTRYLSFTLLELSIFSGLVMCAIMGFSLFLSLKGEVASSLAMLPSTMMILTGMACNIWQELRAYRKFDSYKFCI